MRPPGLVLARAAAGRRPPVIAHLRRSSQHGIVQIDGLGTATRSWTALGVVGTGAAMGEMHRYTDDEKAYFLRRMWAEGLTPASAARLWEEPPRQGDRGGLAQAAGGGQARG